MKNGETTENIIVSGKWVFCISVYRHGDKRTIKLLSIYEARDESKGKRKSNWPGSRLLTSRCANISCDQFHVQTDIYGTLMVSTCNVTVPECVSANHNPSLAWFRFGT